MEEKKSFGTRLEEFFAGKGCYIVLLLCVAVIGVSAWSMLSGGGAARETELTQPVANVVEDAPAVPVDDTRPVVVTERPAAAVTEPEDAPAVPVEKPVQEAPAAATEPPQTQTAPAAAAEPDALPGYFVWPVSGDTAVDYAMTELRYDRTMHDWRAHDGIDIAAEKGTQVRAAAAGTVESVYSDERLGTTVVIRHGGGLESVYANLAATPAVSEGARVTVGQVIGSVGDTALYEVGEVSHLHFAMTRDGLSVDPNEYLP